MGLGEASVGVGKVSLRGVVLREWAALKQGRAGAGAGAGAGAAAGAGAGADESREVILPRVAVLHKDKVRVCVCRVGLN